jgi:RNA polymerase sigma-70 factor (ECF subfamily)
LRSIADADRLRHYPFYPAALGELEFRRGQFDAAREQFASAATLARNPAERRFLERRWRECRVP